MKQSLLHSLCPHIWLYKLSISVKDFWLLCKPTRITTARPVEYLTSLHLPWHLKKWKKCQFLERLSFTACSALKGCWRAKRSFPRWWCADIWKKIGTFPPFPIWSGPPSTFVSFLFIQAWLVPRSKYCWLFEMPKFEYSWISKPLPTAAGLSFCLKLKLQHWIISQRRLLLSTIRKCLNISKHIHHKISSLNIKIC